MRNIGKERELENIIYETYNRDKGLQFFNNNKINNSNLKKCQLNLYCPYITQLIINKNHNNNIYNNYYNNKKLKIIGVWPHRN